MKIILVTGFLGSGKTTFLSNLSEKLKDTLFVINEFSSKDMDSKFFDGAYSIKGGSIFCKCKSTEFLELLKTLKGIECDRIVVECSGMLDPKNANVDLIRESGIDLELLKCICIVDAKILPKILKTLPITINQIMLSSQIIINKIDISTPEEINLAKECIKEINPEAEILLSKNCELELDLDKLSIFNLEGEFAKDSAFVSWSLKPINTKNLQEVLEKYAKDFVRIKGFYQGGKKYIDYDMNAVKIKDTDVESSDNIVFIADKNNEANAQKSLENIYKELL